MRTILHLISTNSNERESALALRLLLLVAQCGRTAKESICEHNGISCVVDCVLSEPPADAQELARDLLVRVRARARALRSAPKVRFVPEHPPISPAGYGEK